MEEQWVFIDGVEVGHVSDSKSPSQVTITNDMKVIAIQISNQNTIGGLIGSLSNGKIVTDETWKCSRELEEGWTTASFDDSAWPAANAEAQGEVLADGITSNAKWIWAGSYFDSGITVYCRKGLGNVIFVLQCLSLDFRKYKI